MRPALTILFILSSQWLLCQPPTYLRWKKFAEINTARIRFEIARIAPDKVLVFGGYADTLSGQSRIVTNSVEILDLRTGTSTFTTAMVHNHADFASVVTPDSNVISIAGKISPNSDGASGFVELFDRKTKRWKVIGSLLVPRFQHEAILLDNDRLIVVGGRDRNDVTIKSAEIFTISTGKSELIEDYPVYVNNISACITSKNKVVFLGGRSGGSGSTQTESVYEYDETINKWREIAKLQTPSVKPTVLKLSNQSNLIVGGFVESIRSCLADIHIEEEGIFSYKGSLNQTRYLHSLAQYNNNYSLVMGGLLDPNTTLKTCEWIDNITGQVFKGNDLLVPRYFAECVTWEGVHNGVFQPRIFLISGSATEGTNFVSKATKTVEVLEIDTALIVNPPTIVSEKFDCGGYVLELSDNSKISNVILDNQFTHNCSFKLSSSLPSKKIIVTISLEDNSRSGKFKLRVENNGGKVLFIENTIKPSAPIELILDKKYRPIFNDSIPIGKISCTVFPLINKSEDTVNVENIYMYQNTNFSIPETSKTKYLFPKDTLKIKVCYTTHTSYESIIDTLVIGEDCNEIKHPFAVKGLPLYENDNNKCKIPLSITQYKSKQTGMPNVFYGDDYVTITVKDSPMIREVYISNIFGTLISPHYQVNSSQNQADVTIDTSMYQTGVYYVVISSDEITQTVPVLLTH